MLAERERESVTQFAQRRPSANFAYDYDHNELFDNHDDYDYNDLFDNHDDDYHDVPSDNCDHHSHHESSLSISLHNGPSTNFAN